MRNVVLGICLLMNCAITFAQVAAKQPQTLITEKHAITAAVTLSNAETIKLNGEAVYHVKMINSDDTFTGKFVFRLSDATRQQLAKKAKQPLTEIPVEAESENVIAEFAKKTECPEIHLEISRLTIKLTNSLSATFERIKLNLNETSQEVSKLVCRYARSLHIGRHTRVGHIINRLLKGEATEN